LYFDKGAKRNNVLQGIAELAKERATKQPVIIMLESEKECEIMNKMLNDGSHIFFYNDDNYEAEISAL